jgi:hypothetical protein
MTQPARFPATGPSVPPASGPACTPPQPDFYLEDGRVVFTAAYHARRGMCCGSGCRHCPYDPPHVEGGGRLAR